MSGQHIQIEQLVSPNLDGERLDIAASELIPDYSRSRLQQWIKKGCLLVDGQQLKAKEKVYEGQQLILDVMLDAEPEQDMAQEMDLEIVYEDDSIIVLHKPVGLVVHPAAGHASNTLMNGLLHYHPALTNIPRAGIVHRLDKDTSGLMVVAKTLQAHQSLVAQVCTTPRNTS